MKAIKRYLNLKPYHKDRNNVLARFIPLRELEIFTNLATIILRYKSIIEKIYGEYKGVEMDTNEIGKIILEKENHKMIYEIEGNSLDKAIDNFFLRAQKLIEYNLNGDWVVKIE